jgi:hypothetical protein
MNTWERGSPAISKRAGVAAIGTVGKRPSRKLITGRVLPETKSSREPKPSLKSQINRRGSLSHYGH